jgi:hypothetical protein
MEPTSMAAETEDPGKQEQRLVEDRLRSWYTIEQQTWSSAEEVAPGSGIWVYRDVLPEEMNIIERLESVLQDPANQYNYQEAMVGYAMRMPEYRDCVDFKYKKSDIAQDTSAAGLALHQLADETVFRQMQAVKDYTRRYNIGELRYWLPTTSATERVSTSRNTTTTAIRTIA